MNGTIYNIVSTLQIYWLNNPYGCLEKIFKTYDMQELTDIVLKNLLKNTVTEEEYQYIPREIIFQNKCTAVQLRIPIGIHVLSGIKIFDFNKYPIEIYVG